MNDQRGKFLQSLIDRLRLVEYFEVILFGSFEDFCARLSEGNDPDMDEVTCGENEVTIRALWLIFPPLVVASGRVDQDDTQNPTIITFKLAYGLGYIVFISAIFLIFAWATLRTFLVSAVFAVPYVALVLAGAWTYRKRLAERRLSIRQWIFSAAQGQK